MPNVKAKDADDATIYFTSSKAGTDVDPHLSAEDNAIRLGATNESAAGTDTATSGLNGLAKRLLQRFTTLLAALPTSLGQKAKSASFAVTVASDQEVPVGIVSSLIGVPVELLDANTGGSTNSRTFTVPAGKVWQLKSLRVSYVSSATAGNRALRVRYETSGGTTLASQRAGSAQAASLTREYAFGVGTPFEYTFGGVDSDYILSPLPDALLKAGQVIRILDFKNVHSAGDSFTVNGLVIEWTVA